MKFSYSERYKAVRWLLYFLELVQEQLFFSLKYPVLKIFLS